MHKADKINPILYIIYKNIERFKGSILLVEDSKGKGLYDLDSNKEILQPIYKSITTYGNTILATNDTSGLELYKYNKGKLIRKNEEGH